MAEMGSMLCLAKDGPIDMNNNTPKLDIEKLKAWFENYKPEQRKRLDKKGYTIESLCSDLLGHIDEFIRLAETFGEPNPENGDLELPVQSQALLDQLHGIKLKSTLFQHRTYVEFDDPPKRSGTNLNFRFPRGPMTEIKDICELLYNIEPVAVGGAGSRVSSSSLELLRRTRGALLNATRRAFPPGQLGVLREQLGEQWVPLPEVLRTYSISQAHLRRLRASGELEAKPWLNGNRKSWMFHRGTLDKRLQRRDHPG